MSHVLHQIEMELRSCWREVISPSQVISRKITQSSANKWILEVMQDGKSLMYIRKSSGPSTEPCGTPEWTALGSELTLLTETNWERFFRKHSSHVRSLGSILSSFNLCNSKLWQTLSKALEKSMNMQSAELVWSRITFNLCVKATSWVSHENVFLKPCWWRVKKRVRLKEGCKVRVQNVLQYFAWNASKWDGSIV